MNNKKQNLSSIITKLEEIKQLQTEIKNKIEEVIKAAQEVIETAKDISKKDLNIETLDELYPRT